MKNNKGFTLIELLAVIVILGIVLSIAIVGVVNYVASSKAKKQEINNKTVLASAVTYATEFYTSNDWITTIDDNSNEYTCVSKDQLIGKGFIKKDIETTVDYIKISRNINNKAIVKKENAVQTDDICTKTIITAPTISGDIQTYTSVIVATYNVFQNDTKEIKIANSECLLDGEKTSKSSLELKEDSTITCKFDELEHNTKYQVSLNAVYEDEDEDEELLSANSEVKTKELKAPEFREMYLDWDGSIDIISYDISNIYPDLSELYLKSTGTIKGIDNVCSADTDEDGKPIKNNSCSIIESFNLNNWYQLNSSTETEINIVAPGIITAHISDGTNHVERQQVVTLPDGKDPNVTITATLVDTKKNAYTNNWYNESIALKFSTTNESTLYYCSTSGVANCTPERSVTLLTDNTVTYNANGIRTVMVKAVKDGKEITKKFIVKIDKTTPGLKIEMKKNSSCAYLNNDSNISSLSNYSNNTWTNNCVFVKANRIRNGVSAVTNYCTINFIDINSIETELKPFGAYRSFSDSGTYNITCTATTQAGNSTTVNKIIKIDKVPPTTYEVNTSETNKLTSIFSKVTCGYIDNGNYKCTGIKKADGGLVYENKCKDSLSGIAESRERIYWNLQSTSSILKNTQVDTKDKYVLESEYYRVPDNLKATGIKKGEIVYYGRYCYDNAGNRSPYFLFTATAG